MVQDGDLPSRGRRGQGVVEPGDLGGGLLSGHRRRAGVEHEDVDRPVGCDVEGAGLAKPAELGGDLSGGVRAVLLGDLVVADSQLPPDAGVDQGPVRPHEHLLPAVVDAAVVGDVACQQHEAVGRVLVGGGHRPGHVHGVAPARAVVAQHREGDFVGGGGPRFRDEREVGWLARKEVLRPAKLLPQPGPRVCPTGGGDTCPRPQREQASASDAHPLRRRRRLSTLPGPALRAEVWSLSHSGLVAVAELVGHAAPIAMTRTVFTSHESVRMGCWTNAPGDRPGPEPRGGPNDMTVSVARPGGSVLLV